MKNESSAPGVEDPQQGQLSAQAFGIQSQILRGLGAGGKEQIVAQLGMRADPGAQEIGQSEREQEIGDGQEQALLARQPIVGVGLAAERAMAVVAGMVAITELLAIRAAKELAAQSGGAAAQDPFQDLALPLGHGRAEALQIIRSEAAQQFVEGERRGGALPRG